MKKADHSHEKRAADVFYELPVEAKDIEFGADSSGSIYEKAKLENGVTVKQKLTDSGEYQVTFKKKSK